MVSHLEEYDSLRFAPVRNATGHRAHNNLYKHPHSDDVDITLWELWGRGEWSRETRSCDIVSKAEKREFDENDKFTRTGCHYRVVAVVTLVGFSKEISSIKEFPRNIGAFMALKWLTEEAKYGFIRVSRIDMLLKLRCKGLRAKKYRRL